MSFMGVEPRSFLNVDLTALKVAAVKLGEIATNMAEASQGAHAHVMKSVVPPGKDVVSDLAATRLVEQAQRYQKIVSQAAQTIQRYVVYLEHGGAAYSDTEDATAKDVTS